MKSKRITCPVCNERFWKHALKIHIRNKAKHEVYSWYINNRKGSKPHQDYIETHTVIKGKEILKNVLQVKKFNSEIGIDAIILTKMDADVKGGCALSIINTIKKPILFIGVGQGYEDLIPFDREWFINKILEEEK